MPTSSGGTWFTYHADSGDSSSVSTRVIAIASSARHAHSTRVSCSPLASTSALSGSGRAASQPETLGAGADTTRYARSDGVPLRMSSAIDSPARTTAISSPAITTARCPSSSTWRASSTRYGSLRATSSIVGARTPASCASCARKSRYTAGDVAEVVSSWFAVAVLSTVPLGGGGLAGSDTLPQNRSAAITSAAPIPATITPTRNCPSEIATDSNIHAAAQGTEPARGKTLTRRTARRLIDSR